MNWTLEVVVVPVSDVDRAKSFYAEQLGFNVDHDVEIIEGNRVVQLTPPGSGCSIMVREASVADLQPGSLRGLQLVVRDIQAAHAQLAERQSREGAGIIGASGATTGEAAHAGVPMTPLSGISIRTGLSGPP